MVMDEGLESDYLSADRSRRQRITSCAKSAATFLFSHLGLAAMVIGYSVMGGFLFKALEAPNETKEKLRIRSFKEAKLVEIRQLADLLCVRGISAENFTDLVGVIQLQFQQQVTLAVKNNGWDGKDETDETALQWSFAGSLLYAVTIITTIGYGHVAPKTTAGRLVTILYALVGIPLTFLYLSNMGNFMAECFRLFYKKICCRICIFCMKSDGRKDPEDAAGEEEEAAAEEEEEDRERMEMAARRNFAFLSVEEEEEEDDDEEEETARGGGRGRGVAIRCPDGSKEEFALRDVEKTGASSPNEKSRSGRRRQADCSGESEGAQVAATAAGRRPRSSGLADETETAVNHFSEVEIHVPDVSSSAPVDDSGDPAPENRITEAQSIPRRPSPLCPRERGASNRLSNGGNNPLRRASGSDAPGFGPKTEGDGQEYIPLRRLQKRTLESAKPAGNGPDQTSKVGASVEMESDGGKVSPPSAADEGASNGQGDDRQQRLMYGQMMATKRRLRAAAAGSSDDDLMTDDEGEVTVPISICLLIIGVYIFSGSLLFTVWEDWDYLTGSYFCFVTLSTIGFGDIVPGTDMKEWAAHQKLVLCSLWLVVGLSLLAMCFNLMQEEVKDWCRSIGHKLGILKD